MNDYVKNIDWKSVDSISNVLLELLPQKEPFRYLDKIIEIDDNHVVGQYTYKKDEWFYKGHFPGNPVTPGVIQIETMAQTAVVSYGLYLALKEEAEGSDTAANEYTSLFVDCEAEFYKPVLPGSTVTVKGEKVFFRRRKLRCKAELYLEDGTLAATATLSGIGVKNK